MCQQLRVGNTSKQINERSLALCIHLSRTKIEEHTPSDYDCHFCLVSYFIIGEGNFVTSLQNLFLPVGAYRWLRTCCHAVIRCDNKSSLIEQLLVANVLNNLTNLIINALEGFLHTIGSLEID